VIVEVPETVVMRMRMLKRRRLKATRQYSTRTTTLCRSTRCSEAHFSVIIIIIIIPRQYIHPFSPTVAAENKNLHTTNITRNLTKHRLYIKVTNKIYWWNRDAKPYERVHLGPLSKRRSVPCGSHLVPGGSQFVGQAYL